MSLQDPQDIDEPPYPSLNQNPDVDQIYKYLQYHFKKGLIKCTPINKDLLSVKGHDNEIMIEFEKEKYQREKDPYRTSMAKSIFTIKDYDPKTSLPQMYSDPLEWAQKGLFRKHCDHIDYTNQVLNNQTGLYEYMARDNCNCSSANAHINVSKQQIAFDKKDGRGFTLRSTAQDEMTDQYIKWPEFREILKTKCKQEVVGRYHDKSQDAQLYGVAEILHVLSDMALNETQSQYVC